MGSLRIVAAAISASIIILLGCEKGQTPVSASAETPGLALEATFRVDLWLERFDLGQDNVVVAQETVKKFVVDLRVSPGRSISASQNLFPDGRVALSFSDLTVTPEGAQCSSWEWSGDVTYGDDNVPTKFSARRRNTEKNVGVQGKPQVFPLGKDMDGPIVLDSYESPTPTGKRLFKLWRKITLVAVGPRKT